MSKTTSIRTTSVQTKMMPVKIRTTTTTSIDKKGKIVERKTVSAKAPNTTVTIKRK